VGRKAKQASEEAGEGTTVIGQNLEAVFGKSRTT